jgi:hypothetical protein
LIGKGFQKRMPVGKRIGYYRSDSALYQADLLNQLGENGVKYAITSDQDKAVKALIAWIWEEGWKEPVMGCGYELAETVRCKNETKKAFRWARVQVAGWIVWYAGEIVLKLMIDLVKFELFRGI